MICPLAVEGCWHVLEGAEENALGWSGDKDALCQFQNKDLINARYVH